MKLKDLAKKPQLKQVTLDDEFIVQAYGEPVEFWMYDRQDLPTYIRLSKISENANDLPALVREMVLDEKGKPVLGDEILPVEIMVRVIEAVVKNLGNFRDLTLKT